MTFPEMRFRAGALQHFAKDQAGKSNLFLAE